MMAALPALTQYTYDPDNNVLSRTNRNGTAALPVPTTPTIGSPAWPKRMPAASSPAMPTLTITRATAFPK